MVCVIWGTSPHIRSKHEYFCVQKRPVFDRKNKKKSRSIIFLRTKVFCFIQVLKSPKLQCWIAKYNVCASNLHRIDSWWLHISRGLQNPRFSVSSSPHNHSSDLLSIGVAACSMLVTVRAHSRKKIELHALFISKVADW